MRVSLVQVFDTGEDIQSAYPPLGFGYLAAYARRDLPDVEFLYCTTAKEAIAADPDIVGISAVSENYGLARECAAALRRETDIPILLGGVHVSMLPETMTQDFDVGVIGEGEVTFTELLRNFMDRGQGWREGLDSIEGICFRREGNFVVTPRRALIERLDDIPHPDRDLIHGSSDLAYSVFSARGCPFNCNFCSSRNFWKRTRFFSAAYIVEEIKDLRERYKATNIFFWDDLFFLEEQRLKEISRLIRESGLDKEITFVCNLRSDDVDAGLCETLKAMNVHSVNLGFESGSNRVLQLMNKKETVEQHEQALSLLSEHGILAVASFMIGYPGETKEDMDATVSFIEEHLGKDLYAYDIYPFIIFPGTKEWTAGLEKGQFAESDEPYRYKIDLFSVEPSNYFYINRAASWEDTFIHFLYLKGLAYKNLMAINMELSAKRINDYVELQEHDDKLQEHDDKLQEHYDKLQEYDDKLQEHDDKLQEHYDKLQEDDDKLQEHDDKLQEHDDKLQE